MAVFQLDSGLWFPNPYYGEESGLVAIGGDLSPERLLLAYSNGFFPWYSFTSKFKPQWYCPLDRFVIFPDEIHVSHSLKTLLNKGRYEQTFNEAFGRVIEGCAKVDGRYGMEGAWLGDEMMQAYKEMHRLGYAKSVEVWEKGDESGQRRLVGGLYGICLGNAFFGESMFSLVPSASKIALVYLSGLAREHGWHFIDCQFETPHLKAMGGRHISYDEYLGMLHN